MTYDEFKRRIGKAGITITEFASLTKANRTSITNCKLKPHVPKHLAVIATLMGDMAENGIDFRQSLSELDIEPLGARTTTFGVKKKPS